MKQYEAVIEALKENGGYATLGQLYQDALKVPDTEWKTKTPFASIRRIVQVREEIFKIRPGLWALESEREKVMEIFSEEKSKPKAREYTHSFYQGLVTEIGNLKGYQTFIPAQDKNKPFAQKKLRDLATLSKFHQFTYPEVLRQAITVDVTWFNERRFPISFFEVEHSTDIHRSLLKFVELQDFRADFYIVADAHRKAEYEDKLALSAFAPVRKYVKFFNYDDVANLHSKMSEVAIAEAGLL
ncbi:MAG: hypothetical protein HN855_10690 [Anaerolineae bacterium]|jgi:hypothetical protein|nr:hypothetical protein [Anaerolineae bacterium]MBT7072544.1 hypothetical protein [Anaerolineae bacterium]MBT7325619.1 hypothetical protein [Anaerolineae bacterium]